MWRAPWVSSRRISEAADQRTVPVWAPPPVRGLGDRPLHGHRDVAEVGSGTRGEDETRPGGGRVGRVGLSTSRVGRKRLGWEERERQDIGGAGLPQGRGAPGGGA